MLTFKERALLHLKLPNIMMKTGSIGKRANVRQQSDALYHLPWPGRARPTVLIIVPQAANLMLLYSRAWRGLGNVSIFDSSLFVSDGSEALGKHN